MSGRSCGSKIRYGRGNGFCREVGLCANQAESVLQYLPDSESASDRLGHVGRGWLSRHRFIVGSEFARCLHDIAEFLARSNLLLMRRLYFRLESPDQFHEISRVDGASVIRLISHRV